MALSQHRNVPATGTVTIANGASLSGALDLHGCHVVAIAMSAAWTAAALTFQGSADGTTYYNVYDDAGNELSLTTAALRYVVFDNDTKDNLSGIRWIKVRSGTAATAANQGAERILTLVARNQ